MQYDQEDLVDLGAATEEVRGGTVGSLDFMGTFKVPTGLTED